MEGQEQITVLGFGRSGTTWISDIISKCLGQIILFEPLHPCVYNLSQKIIYEPIVQKEISHHLLSHLSSTREKEISNRWLLRNHLNHPIEDISPSFIDKVWECSTICGFKSIRLNHNLLWVNKNISRRPVFIIRHPLAVLSSLGNRPRFWKDLGWETHWSLFLSWMNNPSRDRMSYLSFASQLSSIEEKSALMWALTHSQCLKDLQTIDVSPFYYEDFYADPYGASESLLSFLNIKRDIHPSYIFTPSMMTLKTIHEMRDGHKTPFFPQDFWKEHLDKNQIASINTVLSYVADKDSTFATLLSDRNYLN